MYLFYTIVHSMAKINDFKGLDKLILSVSRTHSSGVLHQ